ncbi:MAG: hypothetical protein ACHQM6_02080 [Candidatus Kapaibacterium sp.]
MKKLLQPKFIILFLFLVAAFFLLRKQFEGAHDVLIAGEQSNARCPVHNIKLKMDTVGIYIRKEEPDSTYFAVQKKYFPLAQDTFYLLEWFKDDEHKDITRAQIWYCPACREAKKKFAEGQLM